MVKPARLGSSRRDDARPRARPSSTRPSTAPSATTPRARRGVPARRARPRGVGHRQRPTRDLELYGPGEIVTGHEFYDYAAKYTPGLSETSTRAEVDDRAAGDRSTSIARDAYRAIGAEGFARDRLPRRRATRIYRVRDQHDPGLHADQPLPDDAAPRAATTSPTCACGSSSSPSSATPAPAASVACTPADLPR